MKRYEEGVRSLGRVGRALGLVLGLFLLAACGPSTRLDRERRLPAAPSGAVAMDGAVADAGPGPDAADGAADALAIEAGRSRADAGADADAAIAMDALVSPAVDAAAAPAADRMPTSVDLLPPDRAAEVSTRADGAGAPDAAPVPAASLTPSPGDGDLGALGPADWVHFGRGGAQGVNRKAGVVAPRIRMALVGDGGLAHFSDSSVRLAWSNGTPTVAATGLAEGVAVGGEPGRGFRLEVIGDPLRGSRLKLFIGMWEAQAELVARIGDDPPLPTLVDDVSDGGAERIYTVNFGPSPMGRPLVVSWTLRALHHEVGNVTLRAATLEDL